MKSTKSYKKQLNHSQLQHTVITEQLLMLDAGVVHNTNTTLFIYTAWSEQLGKAVVQHGLNYKLSSPSGRSWSCLFSTRPLLQSLSCRWLRSRQQLSPGETIKTLFAAEETLMTAQIPPGERQK